MRRNGKIRPLIDYNESLFEAVFLATKSSIPKMENLENVGKFPWTVRRKALNNLFAV